MKTPAALLMSVFAISSTAFGQSVISLDLLDPSDGAAFTGIPSNHRVVDIFVDIADSDVWTAGGIRAIAENGTSIAYFDSNVDLPGLQPGLINGGVANKFYTSLSRPRPRDGNGRFNNAAAAVTGSHDPPGPAPELQVTELNVAYEADPPASADSPSVDGYIARIAIDISGVSGASSDYSSWRVTPLSSIPPGASVVLRCVPSGFRSYGTEISTYDVEHADGLSWAISWCPEPASVVLLVLGGLVLARGRVS